MRAQFLPIITIVTVWQSARHPALLPLGVLEQTNLGSLLAFHLPESIAATI